MSNYVGVIDQAQGNWGARIPDLPGRYGAGDSAEAAIRDAASSSLRAKSTSPRARPPYSSV